MLPGLTPPAVLAFLYILIFNGPHGMLNGLISMPLGLPMIDWIRDPRFIKVSLMFLTLWRWSGFITLILLSGMEGIPKSYYDLARSEGAGPFQIFKYVTLPLLSHVLAFAAIFLFLDAFVLFEGGYLLLGGSGGTMDAGLLIVAYTYLTAFTLGKFGSAAAMGFTMVPLLMMAVWLLLLSRKRNADASRKSTPATLSATASGPV
jgi:multiple sugar transport system permease protein